MKNERDNNDRRGRSPIGPTPRGRGKRGLRPDAKRARPGGDKGAKRSAPRPPRDRESGATSPRESFKQVREDFTPPPLADDVSASELHPDARNQLRSLEKDNAEVVAQHLAMASRLIDDDPELAHQHALAASRRAGRIGVVRETLGITAYQLGNFSLALRELRTFRRITGSEEQLPLMVDCERGLGRPEKALELSRSVDASSLPTPVRVELAIARSGARLDLGQKEAALDELRIPELRGDKAFAYSPALFGAFATVLEELGRDEEASNWHDLADRAIDALQSAFAPGDAETMQVCSIVERELDKEDDA